MTVMKAGNTCSAFNKITSRPNQVQESERSTKLIIIKTKKKKNHSLGSEYYFHLPGKMINYKHYLNKKITSWKLLNTKKD